MDTASLLPWAIVAVLGFWSVGAYNRLVRLRTEILRSFAAVDRHLQTRGGLLDRHIEQLAQAAVPGRELDALRAARQQADAARLAAQRQPGAADAIASLRLALQILAQLRERNGVDAAADSAQWRGLREQLAACDHALHFAQGEFNRAVLDYNAALAQIPAAWLGALFGFRRAAEL
jgi:LemA protein